MPQRSPVEAMCVHTNVAPDAPRHRRERAAAPPSRAAADEGKARLYAQPIVSLEPDLAARPRLEGAAAARWTRPDAGCRPDFLPQAERYDLMPAIDGRVVR